MSTDTQSLVVSDSAAGRRLDRFVADASSALSRTRAARLIQAERVLVNDETQDPDYRVSAGDNVVVEIDETRSSLAPDSSPMPVLLETPDLVVVDKRPGLVMHPGAADEPATLAHQLLAHYPEVAGIGHPRRPGIVHRLDRDTSGVVLIARTAAAYHSLQQAFERREVRKRYLAGVHGRPTVAAAEIDAPIGRHPTRRTHMAVTRSGRPAQTAYTVCAASASTALLDVRPRTGRTHQIRVHLASIGHPVLGDPRYGPQPPAATRQLLHAWMLEFTDPAGDRWRVAAAPPADMRRELRELELDLPATPPTRKL
ncbi:MAG: RluA family pseudouridine synthase [Chloroflexi bacterium]|nr:RluA family pseudouridine synthase [Chloroflexota bacterium]